MAVCANCGAENREEARFCDSCGAPLVEAPPVRETRKTVTVLFCDVSGSTALGERLDPESLRHVMARYFEAAKQVVERHGGTVEKFIGDAVMAVFGIPAVHEDDALRAVRAAQELRETLTPLNSELEAAYGIRVELRTGVNTGEVVTGTEERLATGDAVNVAARLEQAAQPGEILLGEETLGLVRDAVEVEPVEPLTLKGKGKPVHAFRLVAVQLGGTAIVRRHETAMVGRERQRKLLEDAFANIVGERACNLFTILGTAGVGKSRLVGEFLDGIDGATVVTGRCLSYGEGITYWPVTEVVKQLLGAAPHERLAELGLDESSARALRPLLGEEAAVSSPEEIAWAVRKLLEASAAERPLVVVFDDIHWGEPTFLDLVEHVADFSRDAPILLLCMARPELLDNRSAWGGGKLNATNVLLEPLGPDETSELVESLLPVGQIDPALRTRILESAGGNPLFVEEMVAMLAEAGNGAAEIAVPPTIQALLAARLDQLETSERAVLERGSVEGQIFHRGAVEALAPDEPRAEGRLMKLVRKDLVRPEQATLSGDEAYRFRHLLIRDAAYEALPKATRAELHERFAVWLEEIGSDLVELDEVVGYHLEQACRYRVELGTPLDTALAAAARDHLAEAGRRALMRQDFAAAWKLAERALALLPSSEIDITLEVDRFNALFFSGHAREAYLAAGAVAERAAGLNERAAELIARIEEGIFGLYVEPEGAADRLATLLDEAFPELEAAGDDLALHIAHFGRGQVAHMRAQLDTELDALEQSLVHAERLGMPHLEAWIIPTLGATRFHGSRTSVPELLLWLDEQEAAGNDDPSNRIHRSVSLAMLGQFDEARAIMVKLLEELEERAAAVQAALTLGLGASSMELFAGDPDAAVEYGLEGCRRFEEIGDKSWLSSAAGVLGQAYYALGQFDEAESWATRAAELGASDDALTQMLWRQVKAKLLARRGEYAEAERLAREAVAIADQTEIIDSRGDADADLAEVLELAGKPEEATARLERALGFYRRKGNVVSAGRVEARLRRLKV